MTDDPSPTPPGRPKPAMPKYKGDELDAGRGPGLGCFWLQVALLAFFVVFTPLTVELGWPPIASAILLFVTIGLLLFVGQTVIFLLRIVAAERRGRRRPVASPTPTVGEIEDAASAAQARPASTAEAPPASAAETPPASAPDAAPAPGTPPAADGPSTGGGMRQ